MGDLVPSGFPFLADQSSSLSREWSTQGGAVPLFDLLTTPVNEDDPTPASTRIFSKEGLKESVIKEIQMLLNARVKIPLAFYDAILQTPYTAGFPELYGIPDFSAFDATDMGTWALYADTIKNAIMAYETRIRNVEVIFEKFQPQTQVILASITGSIVYQSVIEPFSFSVNISKSS